MRNVYISNANCPPKPLNVIGEAVTVFGGGDLSKPFEVHIQEGNQGGGPPPHHHVWDEAFYVLDGEVEFILSDTSEVLDTGSFIHIPGGTTHAYRNVSETAKLLAVVSDSRGGQLFAAYNEHVHNMPEDLPKLIEIGTQFGITWELPEGS